MVHISIGELLDKISILEIKSEKINDSLKLSNIEKEKILLLDKAKSIPNYEHLILKIKKINLTIWDTENHIREKERKKEFDQEFINLARMVYFSNDERFRIKNEINKYYSSDIVEQKSYTQYN